MPTPTIRPTKKQHEAWEALKAKDTVFMGGGAGGGKTWLICESRLVNCYFYPGYKSFIGREELKRLMQSTYVTWSKVCKHHKIPPGDWRLDSKYSYIEFFNGSRIDLLDLSFKPSDPLYERFGSTEYSDGAIEEAGEIHFMAYDVLKSRIARHMSDVIRPTLLITGNPKKNWTYTTFYKPWKENTLPDNIAFIQSLYNDNPYTRDIYGKQLSEITDKTIKERLMFGNWDYDDDPTVLCDYDAICDMFTNTHIEEGNNKYLSADLAMQGRDRFVAGTWRGLVCRIAIDKEKATGREIELDIKKEKNIRGIPNSRIVADSDGLGAYLESYIKNIKEFHGGSSARNKKLYANLKTECGYRLAEIINNREILVICTKDQEESIKTEISTCLKTQSVNKDETKKRLIPKEKMKLLLGHSPDYMDMLLMRMVFEVKKTGIRSSGLVKN
ncbi:phage portal protein [Candidatus Pacearchaeota archaeon]|nr:phage portal protein [Candidatus Pacearchaeota archaeon]